MIDAICNNDDDAIIMNDSSERHSVGIRFRCFATFTIPTKLCRESTVFHTILEIQTGEPAGNAFFVTPSPTLVTSSPTFLTILTILTKT